MSKRMIKNEAKSAELNAAIKDQIAIQLTDLTQAFSYLEYEGYGAVVKNYLNVKIDRLVDNQSRIRFTKEHYDKLAMFEDVFINEFAIQFSQEFAIFALEEGIKLADESDKGVTVMHSGVYYNELSDFDVARSVDEKRKDKDIAGISIRTVKGKCCLITDMNPEGFKKTFGQITIGGDFIPVNVYEDGDEILITTLDMESEAA